MHALRSACQELGRTFTVVWERMQERVHKCLLQPFLILCHLVNPNKHIYGRLLDYYFVLRSTSVQNLIDGVRLDSSEIMVLNVLKLFDVHALRSACQELGRTFTVVWERVQERVHKCLFQPFLIICHIFKEANIYRLLLCR